LLTSARRAAQVLKVYQDGKVVASNTPSDWPSSPKVWSLSVPVKSGSRYLIVQEGDTGDPYGGYRGHSGVRSVSFTYLRTFIRRLDHMPESCPISSCPIFHQ
jgi:hypothetical protein